MGKSPTNTVTKEIPAWLEKALKGVLTQSTQGLQQFGAQGQNILQGRPAGGGGPPPQQGGGALDPRALAVIRANMGQGGRNA